LIDKHIAVDARVEKILDLCRSQDRLAILTGGHHRGFDFYPPQKFEKGDRAWTGLNSARC
jgi:hypothetical protein